MFLWFLSELRNLYDNVIPEMNGDINEENEILRAELDAVSREIELREERIKELKDRRTKIVHCSKVHKVHIFFVLPTTPSIFKYLSYFSSFFY
jgi:hypothetical protein